MAVLLVPSILLFHLTVPLGASLERAVARRLGTDAPSGHKENQRRSPWLLARVAHVEFWRQDLPLCVGGMALSTASFFLAALLGALLTVSVLAPFMSSSEAPIRVDLGGSEIAVSGLQSAPLLLPVGLIALSLLLGALWGLGRLRLLLVKALSGERETQRLKQLTAEVGHLTASRATLMDAFEAERTRIERDLHDGTQQELVALAMNLGSLRLAAESLPEDDAASTSRTALLEGIDTAQDRAESALKDLRETVRGIQTVKLFEKGAQRHGTWMNLFVDTVNTGLTTQKLAMLFEFANSLLFGVANILIVYWGAVSVLDGAFTVGALMAFMSYKSQFEGKVGSLIDQFVQIKMLGLHAERLADIVLEETESGHTGSPLLPEAPERFDIAVENVSFRYADNEPYVLENFSLHIAQSRIID